MVVGQTRYPCKDAWGKENNCKSDIEEMQRDEESTPSILDMGRTQRYKYCARTLLLLLLNMVVSSNKE